MISISIRRIGLILLIFVVLGFLIYSNTFDASFHFDDAHVVSDLSFKDMLERCKSGGSRFVSHFTFLLNYRMGGTDVLGYHIFNTIIHIGTAFFVYMFLSLVLSISNPKLNNPEHLNRILPPLTDPIFWPAFLGGILFLGHPLATQAVTYITQRYASLAGFFYIGSLAFFVSARIKFRQEKRFLTGSHLLRYLCSIVMAVLAMRTKEMAITLPAAVLLTEYYFIQSDFKAAGKRILYLLPLLVTGLIIPVSDMIGVENISFESVVALQDYTWDTGARITRKEYLFTQFKIIAGIYLKLTIWPIGQNIDHDYVVSKTLFDLPTMTSFVALCIILGASLWLFKRARLVSFGILWFFITISPTSSIVPNTEFVAEHRAYIALMGLAFAIAGLPSWQSHWKRYLAVVLPVLLLLSSLTYARNRVWKTDLTLWEDSADKAPKRARPHNNLGIALAKHGNLKEAVGHFEEAVRLKANFADAYNNLGIVLTKQGDLSEAVSHYSQALRIRPNHEKAHNNLGVTLMRYGRLEDAKKHYFEAIRIKPDFADAHYNLGLALCDQGKLKEAITHYSHALRIKPNYAEVHDSLGSALIRLGKLEEAIKHYSEALRIKPDYAEAHNNLGNALVKLGDLKEATSHYSRALKIKPDFVDAHYNLGVALVAQGKIDEAISHYNAALQIKPDLPLVHNNLGTALSRRGKFKEAIIHYFAALRIKPDFAEAHYNLGNALSREGRLKEAILHYSETLRIDSGFAEAHYNLGVALYNQGKLKEAINHYIQVLRIRPDYVEAYNNLGIALAKQGKFKEATRHYLEALRIKPGYAEAHYNLGNTLAKQGRLKKALAHYSEALQIRPDYAEARRNLELTLQLIDKSAGTSSSGD